MFLSLLFGVWEMRQYNALLAHYQGGLSLEVGRPGFDCWSGLGSLWLSEKSGSTWDEPDFIFGYNLHMPLQHEGVILICSNTYLLFLKQGNFCSPSQS